MLDDTMVIIYNVYGQAEEVGQDDMLLAQYFRKVEAIEKVAFLHTINFKAYWKESIYVRKEDENETFLN